MDSQLNVVYHHHSGFSVEHGDTLLVFDYWEENGTIPANGRITPTYLSRFRQIYVLVSHAHPDHFDPVIYQWKNEFPDITYILSSDIPIGQVGKRMVEGQSREIGNIIVHPYPSTDAGLAYLVELDGLKIFHAGDLNLWHWRQESSLREIEAAENAFYKALDQIDIRDMDVAMFPVDPRQGMMYDAGANHFILSFKPRVMIPMHWWRREDVAVDFARRSHNQQTEILPLTKPGTTATIHFMDQLTDIHVIEPPKEYRESKENPRKDHTLFAESNPFAESDLPVNLEE